MERRVLHQRAWRSALSVLVLYRLVLQSLFGGIAATRMSLQAAGVICFDHRGDDAEESEGHAEHGTCCSMACPSTLLALIAPEAKAVPQFNHAILRERRWLAVRFHGPPAHPQGSTGPRALPAAV